jgi:hypothetical protein
MVCKQRTVTGYSITKRLFVWSYGELLLSMSLQFVLCKVGNCHVVLCKVGNCHVILFPYFFPLFFLKTIQYKIRLI